jgi:Na+/H+ antiporter NhaD/arsenite permease-like protein
MLFLFFIINFVAINNLGMTLIIICIILFGYLLLATGSMTNINKAAVAMFMGTVGWVLYISYGTDFVMSQHPAEYRDFLHGAIPTAEAVKLFISQNIFLKYVGKGAEIVLFLLATMTIVEILNNNGCFDFISEFLRTRNSKKLLWMMTIITFLVSANLDNLTTATMMLVIMHDIVPSRKQRLYYGCAIVLAVNCGGCFTVIGDPVGLVLWNMGAVTATNFSAYLVIPAMLAWLLPTFLISKKLPEHLDIEWVNPPYRGDDTNLNRWQRMLMLVLGIGGLWFIPTFHNITKLSPFLGALCVLSVLWIVNELFNRKLMNADQMIQRRIPRVLQYGSIQLSLFVFGIMLALGVMEETGSIGSLTSWLDLNVHNIYAIGAVSAIMSAVMDSFTGAMSAISLYPVIDASHLAYWADSDYMGQFVQNGAYWKVVAYCSAVGGNVLTIGSMSGLALMKMERMHLGWFVKNFSAMILSAGAIGLAVLFVELSYF